MRNLGFRCILVSAVSTLAMTNAAPVFAQSTVEAAPSAEGGDIIVNARKREETAIAVPVVITAVGSAELSRRGINTLDSIARLVPSLTIAEGGGTVQGGTIALRGIAGPDTNPFGDQAVSFNIDNVQIAKASVRRLGNFDIAQVEVLKGPQTLFFGKNSPGGVISMRTADPTSQFAAKLSAGYEFNAHEFRTEGFISGPLTETLGGRLAFYTSDMRGWVKNISAQGLPESPKYSHTPRFHEFGVRGTLLWEPTDAFTARLKYSYGQGHGAGTAANFQLVHCPYGSPQFPGIVDECKANNKVSHADIGTYFNAYEPSFKDGVTRSRNNQQLASLELNYDVSDQLKLTSVTGFYRIKSSMFDQFTQGATALPVNGFAGRPLLPTTTPYYDREFTEEVRLQSDLGGMFDFTVGALYQETKAETAAHTFANPDAPIEFNEYFFRQKGTAYSFFAEGIVRPMEGLEISGGGRYSHEEKKLPLVLEDLTGPFAGPTNPAIQAFPDPEKIKFNNFSPEVTVSYRPNQNLTVFGSYKRGFLSGGFNSSSVDFSVSPDISYGPQKVKGFEGGVKAALLDGKLRVNAAAYTYKITGLQITSFKDSVGTIRNAGGVKIQGLEGDFSYHPTRELTLRGAAAYNHGEYTEYFAPCYGGQTAALGCSLVLNGSPVQDLAGTKLRNAPRWAASAGFSYDMPISDNLKIGVSTDVNYTSSEITDAKSTPGAVSPGRALIDATLRLSQADDRWELALIGRNLTDKHYWANSQELPFTGDGQAGNPFADLFAVVSRGREIMVRATMKFGQ